MASAKLRTAGLVAFVAVYIAAGGAIFAATEGWRYVDGIYFATVTITTVGYGDLNPTSAFGRFFAILYCMCGALSVLGMLLSLTVQFREIAIKRTQLMTAKLTRGASVSDMKRQVDTQAPWAWGRFKKKYSWQIKSVAWFSAFFVLQCACAAIFAATAPGLSFSLALYHCWVTASTLGYGLVAADLPSTAAMRIWMTCHVLLSSTFFAVVIADIDNARAFAKTKERRTKLLSTKLDKELLASLDPAGNGVDKLQFVIGMLTSMEIVAWSEVEPFLKLFDEMDADGSGKLDKDDIAILEARTQQARKGVFVTAERVDQSTRSEGSQAAGRDSPGASATRLSRSPLVPCR